MSSVSARRRGVTDQTVLLAQYRFCRGLDVLETEEQIRRERYDELHETDERSEY